jgi:hypothetical protein
MMQYLDFLTLMEPHLMKPKTPLIEMALYLNPLLLEDISDLDTPTNQRFG